MMILNYIQVIVDLKQKYNIIIHSLFITLDVSS